MKSAKAIILALVLALLLFALTACITLPRAAHFAARGSVTFTMRSAVIFSIMVIALTQHKTIWKHEHKRKGFG